MVMHAPPIRRALGNYGEQLICRFLEKKGFTIQATQFKAIYGEIDIIALRHNVLACVEVKTRSKHYFTTSQVVNMSKQKKIIRTALYYQIQNEFKGVIRFDVALVEKDHKGHEQITYYENAFQAEDPCLF
jgi:putative endonuclease